MREYFFTIKIKDLAGKSIAQEYKLPNEARLLSGVRLVISDGSLSKYNRDYIIGRADITLNSEYHPLVQNYGVYRRSETRLEREFFPLNEMVPKNSVVKVSYKEITDILYAQKDQFEVKRDNYNLTITFRFNK